MPEGQGETEDEGGKPLASHRVDLCSEEILVRCCEMEWLSDQIAANRRREDK
ncbi:hypothetical protein [Algicella marina]|uniref:Uncharacterized protein n=1 Tax=Algicella marina TaxID=2683284 RepID=A0A6P1T0F8_9RHOB|nr:hypothetical protein [Algicella marina]QHQ35255.1 hypothetical protein GO499_08605 [Algicella marina]